MISLEFKEVYDKLSVNDKRDQLSNELMFIAEVIKGIRESIGTDIYPFEVKNYDSVSDIYMTEDDFLTFVFEDVYNIKTELVNILSTNKLIQHIQNSNEEDSFE